MIRRHFIGKILMYENEIDLQGWSKQADKDSQ